jgi:hypothetical protein
MPGAAPNTPGRAGPQSSLAWFSSAARRHPERFLLTQRHSPPNRRSRPLAIDGSIQMRIAPARVSPKNGQTKGAPNLGRTARTIGPLPRP